MGIYSNSLGQIGLGVKSEENCTVIKHFLMNKIVLQTSLASDKLVELSGLAF